MVSDVALARAERASASTQAADPSEFHPCSSPGVTVQDIWPVEHGQQLSGFASITFLRGASRVPAAAERSHTTLPSPVRFFVSTGVRDARLVVHDRSQPAINRSSVPVPRGRKRGPLAGAGSGSEPGSQRKRMSRRTFWPPASPRYMLAQLPLVQY